jgi:phosphatidylserine/phosphatidylglycerophosphate/cardiolipin synthase-like enzyme
MILDQETVITGSFNFSQAANTRNAENLLIIKDKPLATLYEHNWKRRKEKALLYSQVNHL